MRIVRSFVAALVPLAAMPGPVVATEGKDDGGLLRQEVLRTYAQIACAVYDDSLREAEKLQLCIRDFLNHPSERTLQDARAAWIAARIPYLQSEAFRFCDGPIEKVEARINGWPIDESYVDAVAGDSNAGIINNPERFPVLSKEVLASLNEQEGEKNICLGFHAVEFLLWGQDESPNGAGSRSFLDYVVSEERAMRHAARRRDCLQAMVDLLVEDLRTVAESWRDKSPDNYRAAFSALPADEALRKLIHGIGTFGGVELAGERLTVAYQTKEQEDEQSCFSDTTHLDTLYNALGVMNIYFGRYESGGGTKVEGTGLHKLLSVVAPDLAVQLGPQVEASVSAARNIVAPFDRAIGAQASDPAREAIHKTIQALEAQTQTLAEVLNRLGLSPLDSGPRG